MTNPMVLEWAEELANHLGRSAEDIRNEGLEAGDFRVGSRVEIRFPDRSFARFRSAFAVISEARQQVGVFTEHCGYLVFPLVPEMEIVQSQRQIYRYG